MRLSALCAESAVVTQSAKAALVIVWATGSVGILPTTGRRIVKDSAPKAWPDCLGQNDDQSHKF